MAILDNQKPNELHYMIKMGWLVEGTATDAGKHKLTAKGIEQFNRFVNGLNSKDKVMLKLQLAANAFSDVKSFM